MPDAAAVGRPVVPQVDTDVRLERPHAIEISFLALATLYSLSLPFKSTLTLFDAAVLIGIFVVFVFRIARSPSEEPHLVGPARLIGSFSVTNRRIAVGVLLAYAATWVVPPNFKMSALLLAPMTAVVATLAVRDLAGIRGFAASPRMVWLGNISFAFYLIQFPVMALITRFLIGGKQFGLLGWLGFAGLSLVVSTVAGAAIYHWVDAPLMRRFAGRRTAAREKPAG